MPSIEVATANNMTDSAFPFIMTAIGSYLAGSIPVGLIVARLIKGIDIREAGSGNIGATNTGRVLGPKWGLLVLLFDALKGYLPVVCFALLFWKDQPEHIEHAQTLSGVCAILGHMFPVWLKFRGGKGVATTLGVLLGLSPLGLAVAFVTFVVLFICFRIVSLSSIVAAIVFGIYQFWRMLPQPFNEQHWSLSLFSLLVPLLIVIQHRTNIVRLLRGEEAQFQFRKQKITRRGSIIDKTTVLSVADRSTS